MLRAECMHMQVDQNKQTDRTRKEIFYYGLFRSWLTSALALRGEVDVHFRTRFRVGGQNFEGVGGLCIIFLLTLTWFVRSAWFNFV